MSKTRLWIRADASKEIGSGHIFRCLSVAHELKQAGIGTTFICRRFAGNLIDLVINQGFEVVALPGNLQPLSAENLISEPVLPHSEWLHASQNEDFEATFEAIKNHIQHGDQFLIDHFALDCVWEKRLMSEFSITALVIDGQADRKHCADFLIDPNLCIQPKKWTDWISQSTQLKQGFDYVPIASQFEAKQFQIRTKLERVLIGFGGVDNFDFTFKALTSLVDFPLKFDVVVGKHYAKLSNLESFSEQHKNVTLHVQTNQMAELMAAADLAVGAGGTMVWERCIAYLPSILISIAPNQIEQVFCVKKLGIGVVLTTDKFESELVDHVKSMLEKPYRLQTMSVKAQSYAKKRQTQAWTKLLTENVS